MKSTQRLDYHRFAESLVERGLVERDVLNHTLHQCSTAGSLLPELLVTEDLISDWELSYVVCELYHLPFVTVDVYEPSDEALEGLNPEYLRQHGLVPLDRFGKLLTVAMPGIVPTEILEGISLEGGGRILPVVGSVNSNRRWLMEHLPPSTMPTPQDAMFAGVDPLGEDESWTNVFDAGEEAVQLDLQENVEPDQASPEE